MATHFYQISRWSYFVAIGWIDFLALSVYLSLSIKVRWVVIVPFQCIVLTEQFICKNSSIQTLRCHFAFKYWQKKYMWWNDEQKSITHSSLKYTTYKSRAVFEFFLQFCFRYCTKHTSSKSDSYIRGEIDKTRVSLNVCWDYLQTDKVLNLKLVIK